MKKNKWMNKLDFPLGHHDLVLISAGLKMLIEKNPTPTITEDLIGLEYRINKERETHESIRDNSKLFDDPFGVLFGS